MTAAELLDRAGGINRARLAPAELERWMTNQGLATIHDGKMIPTPKARELVDALTQGTLHCPLTAERR